jgi:hypothetical protein
VNLAVEDAVQDLRDTDDSPQQRDVMARYETQGEASISTSTYG